eukprot:1360421-Pleurochrysis_carterae.AAC.1
MMWQNAGRSGIDQERRLAASRFDLRTTALRLTWTSPHLQPSIHTSVCNAQFSSHSTRLLVQTG